jgi:predicted phage tail protein
MTIKSAIDLFRKLIPAKSRRKRRRGNKRRSPFHRPFTEQLESRELFAVGASVITPIPPTSDTTPTITWTAADEATSYTVQLHNGLSELTATLKVNGSTATLLDADALASGNYSIHVRGQNSAGEFGEWTSANLTILGDVPTPVSPIQDKLPTTSDSTPTITWISSENAARYFVQIQDSEGQAVTGNHRIAGNTFTVGEDSALPPGSYTAYVLALNSDAERADVWSKMEFTVASDVPLPATPNVNRIPTTTDTTPAISWEAAQHASRYKVQVHDHEGQVVFNQTGIRSTSIQIPSSSELATGKYQVFVQAVNSEGEAGESWGVTELSVVDTVPTPTDTTITPVGSVSQMPNTVSWSEVKHASHYDIQVHDSDGHAVFSRSDITGIGVDTTSLRDLPAGEYQIFVRAVNSSGVESGWASHTFTLFTTIPTPGIPTLTLAASTSDSTPTISWSAAEHAADYVIQIHDNNPADPSEVLAASTRTSSRAFTVSDTDALPAGKYTVWIKTINADGGTSDWTGQPFTIVVPSV